MGDRASGGCCCGGGGEFAPANRAANQTAKGAATPTPQTPDSASSASPCCPAGAQPREQAVALSALALGQSGVICETCLEPSDAALLRAMGIRPDVGVRLCRAGQPCIVEVQGSGAGCRIGLARDLADRVMVRVSAGRGA